MWIFSSAFNHFCHFHSLSTIFSHFHSFSFIFIHFIHFHQFYPLSSAFIHSHPIWSKFHAHPPYSPSSMFIHFDPLSYKRSALTCLNTQTCKWMDWSGHLNTSVLRALICSANKYNHQSALLSLCTVQDIWLSQSLVLSLKWPLHCVKFLSPARWYFGVLLQWLLDSVACIVTFLVALVQSSRLLGGLGVHTHKYTHRCSSIVDDTTVEWWGAL